MTSAAMHIHIVISDRIVTGDTARSRTTQLRVEWGTVRVRAVGACVRVRVHPEVSPESDSARLTYNR